jgi:abortive infection bacteriophage resistance protein
MRFTNKNEKYLYYIQKEKTICYYLENWFTIRNIWLHHIRIITRIINAIVEKQLDEEE